MSFSLDGSRTQGATVSPRTVHALSLLLCLCVAAGAARAGVSVSPARIEAVVEDGSPLPPITVTNRGPHDVRVNVSLALGGHDLDGMPAYREDREARDLAGQLLDVFPRSFRLPAGAVESVQTVVRLPHGLEGGLYPVIFFEFQPEAAPRGVQGIIRIAVVTVLATAGAASGGLHPEAPGLRQGEPGSPLDVDVVVHNGGPVHARPFGTVQVLNPGGALVDEVFLPPALVLPGHSRRLTARWRPASLPPGAYVLRARLAVSDQPLPPVETAFAVVAPYEVGFVRGEVIALEVVEPPDAGGPLLAAVVHNSGTLPLLPGGSLEVFAGEPEEGPGPLASMPLSGPAIQRGGSGRLLAPLPPGLPAGTYTARLLLRDGEREIARAQTVFQLGATAWADGHVARTR